MGKREDILEATLDLVVEEGLAAFSFSKLFERARVGAGTVYHYFDGKDALLEALYLDVSARLDEGVQRGWPSAAPLRRQIEWLLRSFAVYAQTHARDMAFLESCGRAPVISRPLRERTTPAQARVMALLARGQADGLIRPMDAHLALAIASGLVAAVVGAASSGKYPFGDAELDVLIESAWRALATDAGLHAPRT